MERDRAERWGVLEMAMPQPCVKRHPAFSFTRVSVPDSRVVGACAAGQSGRELDLPRSCARPELVLGHSAWMGDGGVRDSAV